MRGRPILKGCLLASMLAAAVLQPARADFELTDSKGRRIELKDNGTWRYVDAKGEAKTEGKDDAKGKDAPAAAATPEVQADLQLMLRLDAPGSCSFELMLSNHLPYEIVSLVPEFAAQRANGVVYQSKLVGFGSVKPGAKLSRQMQFGGIACQDIAKLQVLGGDRCEMGELNKFSDGKGRCLNLVRVLPSSLLKFEK
jgi:hypothetical protein